MSTIIKRYDRCRSCGEMIKKHEPVFQTSNLFGDYRESIVIGKCCKDKWGSEAQEAKDLCKKCFEYHDPRTMTYVHTSKIWGDVCEKCKTTVLPE